jgi:alkylglycerol monooxygenase
MGELYMFWLHTEVIPKLGPLEYILNTPSHHRVHHGRNPKYIDKNYGGVFIFWDILFGTFEREDPNEPAVYGLVHPVQSYNPWYLQLHCWPGMLKRIRDIPSWKDKIKVPFWGPGWSPGKPRLGHYEDIPKIEYPVVLWDPPMNLAEKGYVIWHFAITIVFYHELTLRHSSISQFTVTCGILALLYTITSLGFIMERREFSPLMEVTRCVAFFAAEQLLVPVVEPLEYMGFGRATILQALRATFLVSSVIWSIVLLHKVSVKLSARFSGHFKSILRSAEKKKGLKSQ